MAVNKKIVLLVIPILILSLLVGCLGGNNSVDDNGVESQNSLPVPVIDAPEKAFFGDLIEFSASSSYDQDGTIDSYFWSFGDNETADTSTVTHTYVFDNNLDIEYPLIFSVILNVEDNNGSYETTVHLIMLYPKEYRFYLDSGKILLGKPSENKDVLKASLGKITSLQELLYEFDYPISIQECSWNATVYIQKPRFAILRSISLTLHDNNGSKISGGDITFGLFDFWKEKTVLFKGDISRAERFKSAKLVVCGFTFGKKINVLYGDYKASQICFDFS